MTSTFNFTRNANNKILTKKVPNATNPKINNNMFTLAQSNSNLDLNVLTLNGDTITSTGAQLNYVNGASAGTSVANKALIPDNTLNVENINLLSCDSLVVNGNNIVLSTNNVASESNSPYLQNINAGVIQPNKALVLNSSLDIDNVNKFEVNNLNNKITDTTSIYYNTNIHPFTWTTNTTSYSNNLKSICWKNNLNLGVIVSSTGANRVLTSSNGTNWTPQTCPLRSWSAVCNSNNKFVAVCDDGDDMRPMTSSNGINWQLVDNSTLAAREMQLTSDHTLILYENGDLYAVGTNTKSSFGTNALSSYSTLTKLNVENVKTFSKSLDQLIIIRNDGTVLTCGNNVYGEGGGSPITTSSVGNSTFYEVPNINNAIQACCSSNNFSMLLLSDGTVKVAGNYFYGQLVNGISINTNEFIDIPNINNAIMISMIYRTCYALLDDGTVKAWGDNSYGQIGNGTTTRPTAPVTIPDLTNVVKISSGFEHCIALLSNGTVMAWGRNNNGQLGDGTTVTRNSPILVPNLTEAVNITSGTYTSYAVLADGTIMAWGINTSGQFGNNTTISSSVPVPLLNINNAINVFAGTNTAGTILPNGLVKLWGNGSSNKLATNSTATALLPIDVWSLQSREVRWKSIAWSNSLNLFVAVGNSTTRVSIMTSNDGVIWNPVYQSASYNLNSVIWESTTALFVAVGDSIILTSPDGLVWTSRFITSVNILRSVAYNNGTFVAVGNDCAIITSSNGTAWTIRTKIQSNNLSYITASPELNLFVAIADSGTNRIIYSQNGVNWWIAKNSNIDLVLNSILWVQTLNRFILVAENRLIYNYPSIQDDYIMSNDNWYNLFTKRNSGNWTITQTGSNPDVELKLNNVGTTSSYTGLFKLDKIQTNNFVISFEIKLLKGTTSVDGTTFIIGNNTGSMDGHLPNSPSFCLYFNGLSTGNKIILYLQGTAVAERLIDVYTDTWQLIEIIYSKQAINTWKISLNQQLIINYSQLNNSDWVNYLSGSYYGFGSSNGGWTHSSTIRRFKLFNTQTITTLDSNILQSRQFNENIKKYNSNKFINSILKIENTLIKQLYPTVLSITPACSIWVSELNCYVIGGSNSYISISYDGTNFRPYRIHSANYTITSICWSPELQLLVAVANTTINNVYTSKDGINWTVQTNTNFGFSNTWNSVCWANSLNLFVAVGNASNANRIMTSSDGINWTIRTGFTNTWTNVCWAQELGILVAVGNSNNMRMYSYDGINWNLQNSNTGSASNEGFISLCWSKDLYKFVAISTDRTIISQDGINWNYYTLTLTSNWTSIVWVSELSMFLGVRNTSSGQICWSNDGETWRTSTFRSDGFTTICWSPDLENILCCAYGNVLSISEHSYNNLSLYDNVNLSYLSTINKKSAKNDYLYNNWYDYTIDNNNTWSSICYSSDLQLFVAVSNSGNIMVSTNAINWTLQTEFTNQWSYVCYANDIFIVVSLDGQIASSNNGTSWTLQTVPVNNNWNSICYSEELNLFVVVGSSGTNNRVITSNNGINWVVRTTPIDNNWQSVCWANYLNLFIAVANSGTNNRIMTSSDGISWTVQNTPIDNNWKSIVWSPYNNIAVAVANSGNNRIMYSYDGINWKINNIVYQPNYTITSSSKSIYAGNNNSCAILNNNAVKHWGVNNNFSLGTPTTRILPSFIENIKSNNGYWNNVKSICTTNTASIVLLNNGSLQSKGIGQLGINTPNSGNSYSGIIDIPNINNVKEITAGFNFVLALLNNGSVKSWGQNSLGQLGTGDLNNSIIPIDVLISSCLKITSHPTSYHSLALLSDNTVMAWGQNTNGQLGINSIINTSTPTLISGLNDVIDIAVGTTHSLALLSNGTIMSWGSNGSGQLGNNTTISSNVPVNVLNITNAIAISAGTDFSVALLSNGTVMTWGVNNTGQLGIGNNTNQLTPVLVNNLSNINAISAGNSHTLALTNNGNVISWGLNNSGQLGNNSSTTSNIPINVLYSTNASALLYDVKLNYLENINYSNSNWSSLCWSNDAKSFIAVSNTNEIMISYNGLKWFNRKLNISGDWTSICWSEILGKYIIIGNDNIILISSTICSTSKNSLVANKYLKYNGTSLQIGDTNISSSYKLVLAAKNNKILRLSRGNNSVDFDTNNLNQLNLINNSNNKIININGNIQLNGVTSTSFNATNLNYLKTDFGIATPNKVLILDNNANISNLNVVSANRVYVNNQLFILSSDNNSDYLTDVVEGIATPNKALILDSNTSISEINTFNSSEITFKNNYELESATNKSKYNDKTAYFANMHINDTYPSNIEVRSLCWSPDLYMFVVGGTSNTPTNTYIGTFAKRYYCINYSYDGSNWFSTKIRLRIPTDAIYVSDIAWSTPLKMFVATLWGASSFLYSYNGIDWIETPVPNRRGWSCITWGNNMFVAIATIMSGVSSTTATHLVTSTDGITWTNRTIPSANYFVSVIYANNIFVATSTAGQSLTTTGAIMTSTDGITWTARTHTSTRNLMSVAYGNNTFVIVSSSQPHALTSTDGITWTEQALTNRAFYSVIWNSQLNLFIAGGIDTTNHTNLIVTSPDGINWSVVANDNVGFRFYRLCYANELSVMVGASQFQNNDKYEYNQIYTSYNAINWTQSDSTIDLGWNDLLYVEQFNKYFAISNLGSIKSVSYVNKQLATSTNGIDWIVSFIDSSIAPLFTKLVWSQSLNLLIAITSTNKFYTTANGTTWTPVTVPSGTWINIIWVSELNMFIAIANGGDNRSLYSSDGVDWQLNNLSNTNVYTSIDYSLELDKLIVTTNTDKYYLSDDGLLWDEYTISDATISNSTTIKWISQLNMFICSIVNNATYYYSYNGIDWNASSYTLINSNIISKFINTLTPTPIWINKFNKLYCITGYQSNNNCSTILESNDGINWTNMYDIPTNHNAYSNLYWSDSLEQLIAYGFNSYLFPNCPFATLTNYITPNNNYNLSTIVNSNKTNNSGVLSSWFARTSNTNNWVSICYSLEKNLFVAVANSGTNNRIMTSTNSIDWTLRTTTEDLNYSSVIYSKETGLFVAIAKGTNKIATSSDGSTWTVRTTVGANNDWSSICWSPELGMFVMISSNGLLSSTVTNDMTSNNSNGKITSASSVLNTGWDAWHAFDSSTTTGWHSKDNFLGDGANFVYNTNTGVYAGTTTTTDVDNMLHSGEWLQIQVQSAITLQSITITPRSGFENSRSPRVFVILGSNNGTSWNLIHSVDNHTNWSGAQTFNISNVSNSYTYFRYVIKRVGVLDSGNGNTDTVQIMNLQMTAAASSTNTNQIMVSNDAINWFNHTSSVGNSWTSICWSPELNLFVAVANSGTNRLMTSSNGYNWTSRSTPVNNDWSSVCWSTELQLFVAVATSGTNDRIMTSSNGIDWQTRDNIVNNDFTSVCWAPDISTFIAIANTGENDCIIISNDGINWQVQNNTVNNNWTSICWGSGYNIAVAVSNSGSTNRILSSEITTPYYHSKYLTAPSTFYIDQSTGNVGLGLMNPSFQLHLSTDSAAKPATSFWSVSSDQRLKENIEDADLDICYNNIKNLRLVRYNWIDESISTNSQLGWIADEVETVFPKSISTIDFNNLSDCKTLDTDQIIVSLFGTVKKLLNNLENQNNTITNLNTEIDNLQNYINELDIQFE